MNRDTIYRDILLEHARHPKNSGRLENPELSVSVHNPLCGDELELTLAISGELTRIAGPWFVDVSFARPQLLL